MNKEVQLIPATEHLPPAFGCELPRSVAKLRPIVENAFEAWLNKTESRATSTAYRNDVIQFLRFHDHDPSHIEEMTRMVPDDVTSWRDHLLAGTNGIEKQGGYVKSRRFGGYSNHHRQR